jgi:phosphoribosyl 1,2-cyclic phosphodiesterase
MAEDGCVRVCSLASGSRGNSLLVTTEDSAVLVDAGLSGKELTRRLACVGYSPESLSGIVITHEHTDHIRGAGVLARRYGVPVYISPATLEAAGTGLGEIPRLCHFACGTAFRIASLTIHPFSISHDAADPAGLTLECGDLKIGIATDLGVVTALVRERLRRCSLLYLESNHDAQMLRDGPYPWHLKQRIRSRMGHLSNEEARDLVSELQHPGLTHVILGHLSEENNRPDLALSEVAGHLNGSGIRVSVAGPDEPGDPIDLSIRDQNRVSFSSR